MKQTPIFLSTKQLLEKNPSRYLLCNLFNKRRLKVGAFLCQGDEWDVIYPTFGRLATRKLFVAKTEILKSAPPLSRYPHSSITHFSVVLDERKRSLLD